MRLSTCLVAAPLRQVVDFRRGEAVIYTGSAEGAVCRLRLQVPVNPGAAVADIKVLQEAIFTAASSKTSVLVCRAGPTVV